MYRVVLVAAAALTACSQTENDRPLTVEYLTEAILQPSCSQYVCHSSFSRANGYVFDTIEESRKSLKTIVTAGDPDSFLLQVLTRTVKRMPYDSPLPNKDIELIQDWVLAGAPGLSTPFVRGEQ
jgi:hypothetical protein